MGTQEDQGHNTSAMAQVFFAANRQFGYALKQANFQCRTRWPYEVGNEQSAPVVVHHGQLNQLAEFFGRSGFLALSARRPVSRARRKHHDAGAPNPAFVPSSDPDQRGQDAFSRGSPPFWLRGGRDPGKGPGSYPPMRAQLAGTRGGRDEDLRGRETMGTAGFHGHPLPHLPARLHYVAHTHKNHPDDA